ncbi:hypothetical protein F5X96DRAFT_483434 [Biscogniauxia mediterranea]|nr:hypothetical protein F5X96DRAFT_483434 [Biscogniauxia mediterranea]
MSASGSTPSIHPPIHPFHLDPGELSRRGRGAIPPTRTDNAKAKKRKGPPIFATHSCPSEFMGRGALDRNSATCHTPMRIHEIRLFLASLGGVTTRNNERLKEKVTEKIQNHLTETSANYQTTTSIYHSTPTTCLLPSSLLPPRTSSRWIRL